MLQGNRLALLVGVSEYSDGTIPPLEGVKYDVQELAKRLQDPNIGNFKLYDNRYLFGQDATYLSIRKAISDIFWQTDTYDIVLFYFSGHGFRDSYENGYIAPYDMSLDEPFVRGINMSELRDLILRSKNKQTVILLLDCCYSGIATKGITTKGDKSVALEILPKEMFEETINLPRKERISGMGRIVIASGEKDRKSREISDCIHADNKIPHPHGWFTFHFIDGIDGKAADDNGIVTLNRLIEHIENNIPSAEQRPTLYVTEGSQLNQIHISISSEKYNNRKKELLMEASQFEEGKIRSLRDAAVKTKELLDLDPHNQDAINIRDKINEILTNHNEYLYLWLSENETKYSKELEKKTKTREVYPKLYTSLEKLKQFDDFVKADDKLLCFIKAISDECYSPGQLGDFVSRCAACFKMGWSLQALMAESK